MIAQFLLTVFAAVLLWKGFHVLVAMGPKTKPAIRVSWLSVSLGAGGLVLAPLCMPASIPLIPVILVLAGESGLAIFSRRAALP